MGTPILIIERAGQTVQFTPGSLAQALNINPDQARRIIETHNEAAEAKIRDEQSMEALKNTGSVLAEIFAEAIGCMSVDGAVVAHARYDARDVLSIVQQVRDRVSTMRDILEKAEQFIAGFEDDPDQPGVAQLLSDIRSMTTGTMPPSAAVRTLKAVVEALDECHEAFRQRKHGGVAEAELRQRLERIFDMQFDRPRPAGSCPNDTNRDGDCHICARMPGGCPNRRLTA